MLTQVYLITRFHITQNKKKIGSYAVSFTEKAVEYDKISGVYINTSSTRIIMNGIIEAMKSINEKNLPGKFLIYCNYEDLVNDINDLMFRNRRIATQNFDLWNKLEEVLNADTMVMKYLHDLDNICLIKLTMRCDIIQNDAEDKKTEYIKDIGVKPEIKE